MSDRNDDWSAPLFDDDRSTPPSKTWILTGVAILVVLLVAGIGLVVTHLQQESPVAPHEWNTAEERAERIVEAFAAADVGVDPQLLAEIEHLFDELVDADENVAELRRLTDHDRLVSRIRSCGVVTRLTSFEAAELRQHVTSSLHIRGGWSRYAIARVEELGDSATRVVYALLQTEDADDFMYRVWIARHADGWKFFDWERLDYGMPESVEEALLFEGRLDPRSNEFIALTHDMARVNELADRYEHEAAIVTLRRVERRNIHPGLLGNAHVRIAYAWGKLGRWRECLDVCERTPNPEQTPGILHSMALCYNMRGHHSRSLEYIARCEASGGWNPSLMVLKWESLYALYRSDEAVESLQRVLRLDAENAEVLQLLAQSLPAGEKHRVIEFIERTTDPPATARSLVEHFWYRSESDLMETLAEFFQRTSPGSPDDYTTRGLWQEGSGRFESAADCYLLAYASETDVDRKAEAHHRFLDVMILADKLMGGYERSPDPVAAFNYIVGMCDPTYGESSFDPDTMRLLLVLHGARHPDDPWLHYLTGLLHESEERDDLAADAFARAAKSDDEFLAEMADSARLEALVRSGRGLEAYRSADNPGEVFRQIAGSLQVAKRADELLQLVAAHRASRPDTDLEWLDYYEGVALAQKRQFIPSRLKLQQARSKATEEYVQNMMLQTLIDTQLQRPDGLSGLKGMASTATNFPIVAQQLFNQKDWGGLREIIAQYERQRPKDFECLFWKANTAWETGDYATIVQLLQDWDDSRLESENMWRVSQLQNQRFRSYLRLGRFDEARRLARAMFDRDGQTRALIAVSAVSGDLETAREYLQIANESYSLNAIYSDEDAREALFSENLLPLRREFPPDLPYVYGNDSVVLLLDEEPTLDESRLREAAALLFGERAAIDSVASRTPDDPRLFFIRNGEEVVLTVTVGRDRYQGKQPQDGWVALTDPLLKSAVKEHRGWIAIGNLNAWSGWSNIGSPPLARTLTATLLDERCRALYWNYLSVVVRNSPELLAAIEKEYPDRDLRLLGESVWLYREEPEDDVIPGTYQQKIRRLRDFVNAFQSRRPDDEFEVQVELQFSRHRETHRVRVEQILTRGASDWRFHGEILTSSATLPRFRAGEPVRLTPYEIVDWQYRTGERIVRVADPPDQPEELD